MEDEKKKIEELIKQNKKILEEIKNAYLFYLNPKNKPHIFLDEIQNVNNWEKFIKVSYDNEIFKKI